MFTEAVGDRHATVSTVDLQFLGIDNDTGISGLMDQITALAAPYVPLDGINDAGVSCAIYMTYQGEETVPTDQNTEKPDLTSTILLRMILDYADNIEEAIAIASAYDLHDSAKTSYHYTVAHASGRSSWKNDDDNGCTVHSAIYNLTNRSVLWVSNENYSDPSAVFRIRYGTEANMFRFDTE